MAEKLIPGLPDSVKIAILQQTDTVEEMSSDTVATQMTQEDAKPLAKGRQKTVFEQAMGVDETRNAISRKIEGKHQGGAAWPVISLLIDGIEKFYPKHLRGRPFGPCCCHQATAA